MIYTFELRKLRKKNMKHAELKSCVQTDQKHLKKKHNTLIVFFDHNLLLVLKPYSSRGRSDVNHRIIAMNHLPQQVSLCPFKASVAPYRSM